MTAEIVKIPAPIEERKLIEQRIRAVLDVKGDDICGFALVVWGRDGTSVADSGVKNSDTAAGTVIPPILIPDFVRSRLLGMTIEQWALEAINPSPPESGA